MIKKWDKFNESYTDSELDEIVNNVSKQNLNRKELCDTINDSFLEDIITPLFKYTEYSYSKISKEIRKFLNDYLPGHRWTDGGYSIKSTITSRENNDNTISDFIKKSIYLYKKIKNDLDDRGYPVKSKLLKNIENICINSLNDDIIEIFDVYEQYDCLIVELKCDIPNIISLSKINDELVMLNYRIEDLTDLENTSLLIMEEDITIVYEFKK